MMNNGGYKRYDSILDIDYRTQSRANNHVRNLESFIKHYQTEKGQAHTNIVDQGKCKSYCIPQGPEMVQFLDYLEQCRINKMIINYAEKQWFDLTDGDCVSKSGIMLDFDILQKSQTRQINPTHYYQLMNIVIQTLRNTLDIEEFGDIFVVFTRKPSVVKTTHHTHGNCFKDGYHMLLPGIRVSKNVKMYLRNQLLSQDLLRGVFADVECINPLNEVLDQGSFSVPVLMYGNSKRGKVPYVLDKVYKVIYRGCIIPKESDEFKPLSEPVVDKRRKPRPMPPRYKYNLIKEFSLVVEGDLIKKKNYECKPSLESQIDAHCQRRDAPINMEDVRQIENEVSILGIHDPNAREIKQLIDTIDESRIENYQTWIRLVAMIAHANPVYKPLAIYMSQRCPKQWERGGMLELEKIWDWASDRDSDETNAVTIKTLNDWARLDNPEEYKRIKENGAFKILLGKIFANDGELSHHCIAKVLHTMFKDKFIFDIDMNSTTRSKGGHWYEFVLPGDNMIKGEVYKWRDEGSSPDNLDLYISEKLPVLFQTVREYIDEKISTSTQDETLQKWLGAVRVKVNQSKRRLGDSGFCRSVISKCDKVFRQRAFHKKLDKESLLLGVGNGVLKLGAQTRLIRGYHKYAISRYTDVDYEPYDPKNPYIIELEKAIDDLFYEDDAKEFILTYLATSLDAQQKDAMFFIWYGTGSNGKSFLLELHINTLGEMYGQKLPVTFLTRHRSSADKSNPAMMELKHARFAYFSESEAGDELKMGNIKELTGGETISARGHHEKQQKFSPVCHFTAATNFLFRIHGNDYGTWRRIFLYNFKMQFCHDPDPENPFEKKADLKFIKVVNRDKNYKKAWLSILVKNYEKYYNVYNCKLANVPHPTIVKETQEYRSSQDTVNKFIMERIRPEEGEIVPLQVLVHQYTKWHHANIRDERLVKSEIGDRFKNSVLKPHMIRHWTGHRLVNHKILSTDEIDDSDSDGEYDISRFETRPDAQEPQETETGSSVSEPETGSGSDSVMQERADNIEVSEPEIPESSAKERRRARKERKKRRRRKKERRRNRHVFSGSELSTMETMEV